MRAITDFSSLLSFLTRIPTKGADLEQAAKSAYLFPLIGLIIGVWDSLAAYVSFRLLPYELAASTTIIALYAFTGLLHLDGLCDFFDGIMAKGSMERKFAAMKDVNIGIAGICSAVFVLITLVTSVYSIEKMQSINSLCKAMIISEISSKLSMNTCMIAGKKSNSGMGSIFIQSATLKGYAASLAISTAAGVVCAGYRFFFVYVGVIVALVLVKTAHRNFGSVSGDAMGASNEISRITVLFLWSALRIEQIIG